MTYIADRFPFLHCITYLCNLDLPATRERQLIAAKGLDEPALFASPPGFCLAVTAALAETFHFSRLGN